MKRVVFKLSSGDTFCVIADCIDLREDMFYAWEGESTVAICKKEIVDYVCMTSPVEKRQNDGTL